jgi:hypothetical protein
MSFLLEQIMDESKYLQTKAKNLIFSYLLLANHL